MYSISWMVECFFFVQDQLPASMDNIIIGITGIATCARSKAPERVVEATPGPPATPHSPLKGGRRSELGAAESHTTYAGLRGDTAGGIVIITGISWNPPLFCSLLAEILGFLDLPCFAPI